MSEETFHVTKEDIRKLESRESRRHGGRTPADSDASLLKSIVDAKKSRSGDPKVNLELPEDPPRAGDMKSFDARTTGGIGSGRFSGDVGTERDPLREPVAQGSAVREDGKVLHKGTVI